MQMINTRLTTPTVLAANNAIPVGTVMHKAGCNLKASGSVWTIEGSGYYKIIANVTIDVIGADVMIITLNDNGVTIAEASATPTAAGAAVNLTIPAVIYKKCACANSMLTLTVNSAGTVAEADVVIERM